MLLILGVVFIFWMLFLILRSRECINIEHQYKEAQNMIVQFEKQIDNLNNQLKQYDSGVKTSYDNLPPTIKEINFYDVSDNDILKSGWVSVPENGKVKINFQIEGDATNLNMYIAPTGTETYLLQEIIDTVYILPDQSNVEYIWEVPNGTLGHFWVIVYNGDVARESETYNIYYE